MPKHRLGGRRQLAVIVHLAISAATAGLVSLLIYRVWYPHPYDAIAGGTALFLLLIGVDVVLGPALTGVIANPKKPLPELRRDLGVIVAVQLAGLAYGLYTMAQARPVYASFEVDRIRVVAAADVDTQSLSQAPSSLRTLPWTGPRMIAAVKPTDPADQMRSVELGFAGLDLSMIPRNWREYGPQTDAVWRAAKPVETLLGRHPEFLPALTQIAARDNQNLKALRFLPLVSRHANWVAVIGMPDARVVGYLPVDGFL